MDLESIKELLLSPRPSDEYLAGVDGFLDFAYMGKSVDAEIRCPCVKCVNTLLLKREQVYDHLVCSGISPGYNVWGCHGETATFIFANKQCETRTQMRTNKRSRSQFKGAKSNMQQLVEDVFAGPPTSEPETQNPKPVLGDVTYYGRIIDIIQLNYSGQFSVDLFKCEWVDVSDRGIKKDKYGYTLVNFSHLMHKGDKIDHEPFIFPNQADQVFYVEDELNPGWSLVMHNKLPRDICDTGNEECIGDIEAEPFHVSHLTNMFKRKRKDKHWVRSDVEGTFVDANNNALSNEE